VVVVEGEDKRKTGTLARGCGVAQTLTIWQHQDLDLQQHQIYRMWGFDKKVLAEA